MAIWVCRTGTRGQFESDFYENSAIYLTRDGFDYNVATATKETTIEHISDSMENAARQTISNTWSQIDIFAHRMQVGDIVIVPKKNSSLVSIGIIAGDYKYNPAKEFPFQHERTVRFLCHEIDTTTFPQDIKYSLRAYRTVFSIKQEERFLEAVQKTGVDLSSSF